MRLSLSRSALTLMGRGEVDGTRELLWWDRLPARCPLVAHSSPDDLTFSLTASRCYLMGVLQSVLVPGGLLASGKVARYGCIAIAWIKELSSRMRPSMNARTHLSSLATNQKQQLPQGVFFTSEIKR